MFLPISGRCGNQFDIDWGQYLAHDAEMLALGGAENVVSTCQFLPLLTQGIESSASQVASLCQPTEGDAERKMNDVAADDQSEYDLADPFDNEEEYVGADDENTYDVTMPITITEQPGVPTNIEECDNMDKAEVIQHIQEEAEVADIDPLQYNIAHDPKNPDIRVGALFPEIESFRKEIRHYAMIANFEFTNVRTDQSRCIAECAYETCQWPIHESKLCDEPVIMICLLCCSYYCLFVCYHLFFTLVCLRIQALYLFID
jgi:hypothetical protein